MLLRILARFLPWKRRHEIVFSTSKDLDIPAGSMTKQSDVRQGETTQEQDGRGSTDKTLLDLPNEVVLLIAGSLDPACRVLFSLSCHRFRGLLTSHLDLTLDGDRDTKVRMLQLLELDHPEFLTCRYCGLLYRWRTRAFFQYRCPRSHSSKDVYLSYCQYVCGARYKCVEMGRAVVDLILRASEHGPEYGVPVSILNISGMDWQGVSRRNEARLVDGQLILASHARVEVESGGEMTTMRSLLVRNTCLHVHRPYGLLDLRLEPLEQVVASMIAGSEVSQVFKCAFCETDYQLGMEKGDGNRTTLALNVWRNYGRRYQNGLSNEQIFHQEPRLQLDARTLAQRDVRAVFESGQETCL